MGKPYGHQYLNAATSSHGTMQCGACGKKIVEGEYRCYQRSGGGDWYYVTHHRACCADDAGWAKKDKTNRVHEARMSAIAEDVRNLLARYPAEYAGVIHEEMTDQAGFSE